MQQDQLIRVSHIPIYDDNYVWIIHLPESSSGHDNAVIVVDPGDATAVITYCESHKLRPVAILITHSHWDHVTGLEEVYQTYSVPVYAPEHPNIPVVTHPVSEDSTVTIGALSFKVWSLPGHMPEHVAYLARLDSNSPYQIFSGDVMFSAGCGRIFIGSHEELKTSLDRINALPENTYVYGTHEYTAANLAFAAAVEPENKEIHAKTKETQALRKNKIPTLPTQLKTERLINPYLRVSEDSIIRAASNRLKREPSSDLEVFSCVREWKNEF